MAPQTIQTPLALRPREAAKALSISSRQLWQLTLDGHIPYVRVGRSVLYPMSELQAWLNRQVEAAKGPIVGKEDLPVDQLLANGESTRIEVKSTLRVNLHTGQPDKKMEHSCLKTIAAFLNSHGGHLIVGVSDSGEALGIETDGFPNEDRMNLHLVNLIKDRIGPQHMLHIEPRFETFKDKRVLVVRCHPSNVAVFLKEGSTEQFFSRTGAATTELLPSQIQVYFQQRF